ncbi:hypothetical protein SCHPADRAFT_942957 [Schizopora paradoxa]|uniref:Uncharacterized protein n=1 Tax=Schizopora paradoxa TaxID=27342 RepID=A0A0H2RLF5_9AGAM|nr:hypothetical protein SCHPADRAFT_942957 [Schizopora paradoxa]
MDENPFELELDSESIDFRIDVIEPSDTHSIPEEDEGGLLVASQARNDRGSHRESASSHPTSSPRRVLRHLYSLAGSSIERNVYRLVIKSKAASRWRAARTLGRIPFWRVDELADEERNKVCGLLLGFARSEEPDVQAAAFQMIIRCIVRWPLLQQNFRSYCETCGQDIDFVVHTWKRLDVAYDAGWNHIYQVATLCLTSNSIMDFVIDRELKYRSLDFSFVEGLFTLSRNVFDSALALEFIGWFWDGTGLADFVKRNEDHDRVVIKLACAIRTRFEIAISGCPQLSGKDPWFDDLVIAFIREMWGYAATLESLRESEAIPQDADKLMIWSELYKIYSAVQSIIGKELTPQAAQRYPNRWSARCELCFSRRQHGQLREAILKLEIDNKESVLQEFPPIYP